MLSHKFQLQSIFEYFPHDFGKLKICPNDNDALLYNTHAHQMHFVLQHKKKHTFACLSK